MEPFISGELRDIHGLDSIPWWPLAPGWWLLLAVVVLLLLFAGKIRRRLDWRPDARSQLNKLYRQIKRQPDKATLAEFSELMRRLAIARYGRESCAGLQGEAWLSWLQAHDPKRFRWQERGQLLLSLPYAPPDAPIATNRKEEKQVRTLFRAARAWVDAELPKRAQKKAHIRAALKSFWQFLKQLPNRNP
ncbi:DUF4381 domain-containing protein [Candidatus Venteria ishoeyi]|uniref:DUF4381 domain-containing protein n=1 Tax=Candidatus Venteria ishoeyi TaxID=1899563 RepID=A0A1H6FEJ6_9GAMM|nr:DUF4381 domain-containing protein [Candidatus Venteria ishoeyi]SEH08073.1 Uncharacterised protein [Candidatus Venteria ishoeyi]